MPTNKCMIELLERMSKDIDDLKKGKEMTEEGYNIFDRLFADNKRGLKLHITSQKRILSRYARERPELKNPELKYIYPYKKEKKTELINIRTNRKHREPPL